MYKRANLYFIDGFKTADMFSKTDHRQQRHIGNLRNPIVREQRNERNKDGVRADRNYSVRGKLKALFTSATNLMEGLRFVVDLQSGSLEVS